MKLYCCYDKGILCVYASSYGGCLCSACINNAIIEYKMRFIAQEDK